MTISTVQDLFNSFSKDLQLSWDGTGKSRTIFPESKDQPKQPPVGPFNMIRPNQIQIIGPPEFDHLRKLMATEFQSCLKKLFATRPVAIIFTNNLPPTPECSVLAGQTETALMRTPLPDYQVITSLLAYFSQPQGESILVHGVFMEVIGKGVLLTGDPGIGKSELALELISRGHRLITDDATLFTKVAKDDLSGEAPPLLQDFLEVRGLGVMNIQAMFGNSAMKPKKILHLVVELKTLDEEHLMEIDRLSGSHSTMSILGVDVPQTTIPVAPGRNLAILVETAVRLYLLKADGYDAAEDFSKRQQAFISTQ